MSLLVTCVYRNYKIKIVSTSDDIIITSSEKWKCSVNRKDEDR